MNEFQVRILHVHGIGNKIANLSWQFSIGMPQGLTLTFHLAAMGEILF